MRVRAICAALPFNTTGQNLSIVKKKSNQLPVILLFVLGLTMLVSASFGQNPAGANEGLINVKGTVSDSIGGRLTGVTVLVNGVKKSTTTNNSGEFELSGVRKNSMLTLSMVGFKTIQVRAIENITVQLFPSIAALDEVIVTGFQNINKQKFTGASVTLRAEDVNWMAL